MRLTTFSKRLIGVCAGLILFAGDAAVVRGAGKPYCDEWMSFCESGCDDGHGGVKRMQCEDGGMHECVCQDGSNAM
jgi:hypothetical protein